MAHVGVLVVLFDMALVVVLTIIDAPCVILVPFFAVACEAMYVIVVVEVSIRVVVAHVVVVIDFLVCNLLLKVPLVFQLLFELLLLFRKHGSLLLELLLVHCK